MILFDLDGEPFARGIYGFVLFMSYFASSLGVLALMITGLKYQKDQYFNPEEKEKTRKELFETIIAAFCLIIMPLITNILFWIITGEPIGWGIDEFIGGVVI